MDDYSQGYALPTLESYIPTPKKQQDQQMMMDAVVAALRGQAGGVEAPVIGAGMGTAATPTGNVVSANAGLGGAINSGVDMGTGIANALRKPTPTPDYAAYPTGGGLDF